MVQLAAREGYHRANLRYFWARVLEDGKTVETQFSTYTGEQRPWPPCPKITKVMLMPFYPELVALVARYGETAEAVQGARYEIDLDPNKVIHKYRAKRFFTGLCEGPEPITQYGEEGYAYTSGLVTSTSYYRCEKCGELFQWDQGCMPILQCPKCGTRQEWECLRCGAIELKEYTCPQCKKVWIRPGEYVDGWPAKCPWCGPLAPNSIPAGLIIDNPMSHEDVYGKQPERKRYVVHPKPTDRFFSGWATSYLETYLLIKNRKSDEKFCPICMGEGHVEGLNKIENLTLHGFSWLDTRYIIGKEDGIEIEVGDEVIKGS